MKISVLVLSLCLFIQFGGFAIAGDLDSSDDQIRTDYEGRPGIPSRRKGAGSR